MSMVDRIKGFRQMVKDAGRDPDKVSISIFHAAEDLDELKRYRDLGVTRTLVGLPSASTEEVIPILDRWAELMRKI